MHGARCTSGSYTNGVGVNVNHKSKNLTNHFKSLQIVFVIKAKGTQLFGSRKTEFFMFLQQLVEQAFCSSQGA